MPEKPRFTKILDMHPDRFEGEPTSFALVDESLRIHTGPPEHNIQPFVMTTGRVYTFKQESPLLSPVINPKPEAKIDFEQSREPLSMTGELHMIHTTNIWSSEINDKVYVAEMRTKDKEGDSIVFFPFALNSFKVTEVNSD